MTSIRPQNLPETIIWWSIIGTYGLYYLGAQFVWVPLMGWGLLAYLIWQWWHESITTPVEHKILISKPVWIWIIAMIGIEVALLIGHANHDLGFGLMIKSSLNRWVRQWALLAIFPLLGALPVRPKLIIRAVCILCAQCLVIAFLASVFILGLKLQEFGYDSPLNKFGGGEIFYRVKLLGTVKDLSETRMQLFAPWPPALGLTGNLFFWIVMHEQHRRWKALGLLGALAMIIGSFSRLGILALPAVAIVLCLRHQWREPIILFGFGLISLLGSVFSHHLIREISQIFTQFSEARAGSSRTRALLQTMGLERWWTEAPIWGHGTIEPKGPQVVGFMPIGTHHQWVGALYSHGAVGCGFLILAFLGSFFSLMRRFDADKLAQIGIALWFVLFFFSWAENMETIAYIFWPALLMMGLAYKNMIYESAYL